MTTMTKNLGPTTLIVVTIVLATGGRSAWAAEETSKAPTISVTGTGRIAAKPDLAEILVGVVSRAETAQAALAQNNQAMARLYQLLKERGVAEKDIQTSRVQLTPQFSQPVGLTVPARGRPVAEFIPRIVGYYVENPVRITSRAIEKLGPLLDALVEAGANQIQGIFFRVEHPEPLLDEARRHAMAHARHKAELLAAEAEVRVGGPLRIEERESFLPPASKASVAGAAMMMAAAAPSMQVSPGEHELSITVSVEYLLISSR
jgi:uncharacterized protein YggE